MGPQSASSAVLFLLLLTQMGVGQKNPVCPLGLSQAAISEALSSGSICFSPIQDLGACLDRDQIEPGSLVIKYVLQKDQRASVLASFRLKKNPRFKTSGLASLVRMESGEWYCPAKQRLLTSTGN